MLANLKRTEESIKQDLGAFGDNTVKIIHDKVSELQNKADKSLDLLMETKAHLEARIPSIG
jgi:hypothetical protein